MMDINCTHKCRHQMDGKCNLTTTSYASSMIEEENDIDCPYFEKDSGSNERNSTNK